MTVHIDRSLRLPDSEYFADPQAKSGIALHHTVCHSARTTLRIWRRDTDTSGKPKRIATAFVIDLDGTIYEAFDPAGWAWHFGLPWPREDRVAFEKRFIGIESWIPSPRPFPNASPRRSTPAISKSGRSAAPELSACTQGSTF